MEKKSDDDKNEKIIKIMLVKKIRSTTIKKCLNKVTEKHVETISNISSDFLLVATDSDISSHKMSLSVTTNEN